MFQDKCSGGNTSVDSSTTMEAYLTTVFQGEPLYLSFQNGVAVFKPQPTDIWRFTTNDECNPPVSISTFLFNVTTTTFLTVNIAGFQNTAAAQVFIVEFTGIENTYRIKTVAFQYLQIARFGDDLVITTTADVFSATPFMAMPTPQSS